MKRPIIIIILLVALGVLIYTQLPSWKRDLVEEVKTQIEAKIDTTKADTVIASPLRDTLAAQAANEAGMAFYASGQLDSAAVQFTCAQEQDPIDPKSCIHLAVVRAQQGRPGDALRALNEALRRDSTDAQTWVHIGKLQSQLNNRKAARSAWAQALALNPDHVEARHLLDVTDKKTAAWPDSLGDTLEMR